MADIIIQRLGQVGVKTALRLVERAIASASGGDESSQLSALEQILDDLAGDEVTAKNLCEII
jgi:hypothetical protein